MKGTMLIYKPDVTDPERKDFDHVPPLQALQQAVGGYIEKVPGFDVVSLDGENHDCFALCNEEGKLRGLPRNDAATQAWWFAVAPNVLRDVLVGNVIVLYGDDEFMEAL